MPSNILFLVLKIMLYTTEENYRFQKNVFTKGETDKKGRVTFRRLQPIPYYYRRPKLVEKNNGLAVLTESLQKNKINKVNVLIE